MKAKLTEMGVSVDAAGSVAFAKTMARELGKWSQLIRVLNLKPDG